MRYPLWSERTFPGFIEIAEEPQCVATGEALQLVSTGGQTVTAKVGPQAVATGGHFVCTGGHFVSTAGHFVSCGGHLVSDAGQTVASGPPVTEHEVCTGGHSVAVGGHAVSFAGHLLSSGGHFVSVGGQRVSNAGHLVKEAGHRVLTAAQAVSNAGHDVCFGGHLVSKAGHFVSVDGQCVSKAGQFISVNTGATIASNLLNNAGSITVKPGGTFSAGTFPNTGSIVNSGTLDATGITNTGTINYRGASSIDSFGPITNNAGGAISLDATGAPSVFFYDDLTHKPGASFTVASGTTANFLGNVTGGGDVTNSGAMNLSGGKAYALGTISGSGSTVLFEGATLSAKKITQTSLTLNSSGTSVAVVTITPAATAGTLTSKVNTLSIAGDAAPTARLDLTNTNLIVDYTGTSPLSTIRAQIQSGFNASGTHWTGNGIISSTAAAGGGTALGYAEASVALALSGSNTANWFGQTADATSVLIRYTKLAIAILMDPWALQRRTQPRMLRSPSRERSRCSRLARGC